RGGPHSGRGIESRPGPRHSRQRGQAGKGDGRDGLSNDAPGVRIAGAAARRGGAPEGGAVTDRVALVTGAARGQGAAIVRRLHADGFCVAACDVRVDELTGSIEGLDDTVIDVHLDVTSEDQWNSA